MNNKLFAVLKEISDESYHTAHDLATSISVSEKTARIRIKELHDFLAPLGATIVSKSNMGYKLLVNNRELFSAFIDSLCKDNVRDFPRNSDERTPFILTVFLECDDYIKLEDLCDQLYVSRNTMTADLKKVEYILNIYNLRLERRPNYGIALKGSEFDKRNCIANSLLKRSTYMNDDGKKEEKLKFIGNIILVVIHEHDLRISEISLENLISHVYITIVRYQQSHRVLTDNDTVKDLIKEEVIQAAKDIVARLQQQMDVHLPASELYYLALHMGAKLSYNSYKNNGPNLVISGRIDKLTWRMLEIIQKSFKIDFLDNLELRMSLNQHMVPLDIRMQYAIPMSNPLLYEVKKEYAFAYTMAATACIALSEYYKIDIPENEIGYFAILFQLAIEKKDKQIEKKNIVVVCASGKGTTQLFMYKYKKAFGKYIDTIHECTIWELDGFDFKGNKIDYIFTTIPVNQDVPVPVFEVNLFMESKDVAIYSEILETGSNTFLKKYYHPELFWSDIEATTKEDVIQMLCRKAGEHYDLPDNFLQAVMKREMLGQTDFGSLVAIPHPYQVMTKENFVVVGILRQPIWWGYNDVQVVFLISISSEDDSHIARFYQSTTRLLFDSSGIQHLIDNPEFDVLLTLLDRS